MSKPRDIVPNNDKGELHGYCEVYWDAGQLMCQGVVVNGKGYGYYKWYDFDGSVDKDGTGYFFNGDKISDINEEGYCYIWCKEAVV